MSTKNPHRMNLWKSDMARITENYCNHFQTVGIESPDATMNRSEEEHQAHFKGLLSHLSLKGDVSILDIGCGKGSLIPFIHDYFPQVSLSSYLGIDLVSEFLGYARRVFPQYRFELSDFLAQDFSDACFDCVIALGVLVMRTHDYETFVEAFIRKMCRVSSRYVLFNVISEINETTAASVHSKEIGFPTVFPLDRLEKILQSIASIRYEIKSEAIFGDSTDSFVTIWKKNSY